MLCYSKKISKNFSIEISGLFLIRSLKDGFSLHEFEAGIDWYRDDHKPSIRIKWIFCNFMIFDFLVYNINHIEEID